MLVDLLAGARTQVPSFFMLSSSGGNYGELIIAGFRVIEQGGNHGYLHWRSASSHPCG
jgi:hypothetical protein